MEWMLMPLRRYADFSGRSRRKEYWLFVLGFIIAIIAAMIVESLLGMSGMIVEGYGPLSLLLVLALFIPALAVQVRRFHDQDKSGLFVLLGFIPFIGSIVVIVFMCFEGTRGDNRFGPDPKGQVPADTFA
jgi:uncharacterized membrane protein YhaH (DUF805 family)